MTYVPRRYYGGPGFGRGRGYGRGYWGYGRGYGRRFISPNCDWFPDLPRGWWAMPEYQSKLEEIGYPVPPSAAVWDRYGRPTIPEAIDHEISMIEKEIVFLKKEIDRLRSLKETED